MGDTREPVFYNFESLTLRKQHEQSIQSVREVVAVGVVVEQLHSQEGKNWRL